MTNPLHTNHQIHEKGEWDALRNLRYDGQEDIGDGMARVDLFDDARNTHIMVYCPAELLPDVSFWSNRTN